MISFTTINARLRKTASIALMTAAAAGNALAATVVDLAPSDDTYVEQSAPTATHGSDTKLSARENSASTDSTVVYLRFDLASLGIPDPALITGAVLNMRQQFAQVLTDVPDPGVFLHHVGDDGWDEATLDWNARPALGPLLERKNLRLTAQETAANAWRQWDLLDAGTGSAWSPAADVADGALSLALYIGDHASALSLPMEARYLSSEDPFDPAYLQITVVPVPAALPMFGAALLGMALRRRPAERASR